MAIPLGRPLPDASSDLTRGHWERAAPSPLYLILLRMGFARPTGRPAAGALLPHLFTLTGAPLTAQAHPRVTGIPAVCFLLHFPWGRPHSLLASILPCGARTFLSPAFHGTAAIRPAPPFIISAVLNSMQLQALYIDIRHRPFLFKYLPKKGDLCYNTLNI